MTSRNWLLFTAGFLTAANLMTLLMVCALLHKAGLLG